MEQYWNIRALDTNKLQKVINKPWTTDNQTFSDRLWKHKEELTTTLQKSLTQAIIRGDKIEEVTKTIKEQFNVSKGKAGRLVMTKSAFFSSAGQKECFNSLNVKQYEIVATLDTHTSKICQAVGGNINIVPRINNPPNIKTPDYVINNEKFDLKQITGEGKYVYRRKFKKEEKTIK